PWICPACVMRAIRWPTTWSMRPRRPRSCGMRKALAPPPSPMVWACWLARRLPASPSGMARPPGSNPYFWPCAPSLLALSGMATRRLNKTKLFAAGLLVAFFAVLLYQFGLFVMVLWLSMRNPGSSAFMDARLAELRQSEPDAALKYQWVPYADIGTSLKRAVIASEDANFTDHEGVEWDAIRKAWEYNRQQAARGKAKVRGGSTITQQLAKNLFLSGSRTYLRKGQELVLTYMIEFTMSKERILELYLNVAQWGTNVFGAEAAARHYFNV